MRKLILLALAAWAAKKLGQHFGDGPVRTPFPTSGRPPEGYKG